MVETNDTEKGAETRVRTIYRWREGTITIISPDATHAQQASDAGHRVRAVTGHVCKQCGRR